MRIFKSEACFHVKDRGVVLVIQPYDLNGLTFGELDSIIKNQEPIVINQRMVKIVGYEYFAVYREDDWLIGFPVGLLVKEKDEN